MIDILKYSVGIDVSSEDLAAGFGLLSTGLLSKVGKPRKFRNTNKGFKSIDAWIQKQRKETFEKESRLQFKLRKSSSWPGKF